MRTARSGACARSSASASRLAVAVGRAASHQGAAAGATPARAVRLARGGDALGFLKAMGGLTAAPAAQLELCVDVPLRARIYTEPATTRYGQTGKRIEGVEQSAVERPQR